MKNLMLFSLFFLFFAACQSDDEATGCVENPQEDCTCYEIYDPVCGCNEVTYSNSCFAECAGITDYTPGPCPE